MSTHRGGLPRLATTAARQAAGDDYNTLSRDIGLAERIHPPRHGPKSAAVLDPCPVRLRTGACGSQRVMPDGTCRRCGRPR